MTNMTITEALAEIKLITSKLEKKRTRVLGNLMRCANQVDPLGHEGGSIKYLESEVQSIAALEENLIKIRGATGWEVEYCDYRDTLKYALGAKYNPATAAQTQVYYEGALLPEEKDELEQATVLPSEQCMNINNLFNNLYAISGWVISNDESKEPRQNVVKIYDRSYLW